MTVDIGIVFLPNKECKEFAIRMTSETAKAIPGFKEALNHPHITAIHIANLNESRVTQLKEAFGQFYNLFSSSSIKFPIKGISATGGSQEEGYKWLDLQFETTPALAKIRQVAIDTFCPFHNGILRRMNDDMLKFNQEQKNQIEKCGVAFGNYLPHITAWYIDLPNEPKTTQLQDVAISMAKETASLTCYAESIAMVELGRNGNAISIVEQYSLRAPAHTEEHTEL